MTSESIPPINDNAEKAVISCVLREPGDVIPRVLRLVRADDFYWPPHRTVFETCLRLWNAAQALDVFLLTDALRKAGNLEEVGGNAAPTDYYSFQPTTVNAEHYAAIVRETSRVRQIWTACARVHEAAGQHDAESSGLVATLSELLAGLSVDGPRDKAMRDHVGEALERYEAAHDRKGKRAPGIIPTGLKDLDAEIESGLHPTDFVVVAAATSGGKTALAIQTASMAAVECGEQVLVASYEMSAEQLTDRLIALASTIPSNKLRGGFISEWEYAKLANSVTRLNEAGIHLRDRISHWTVDDIATEARAIKARHGLGMIIVDYLQLANPRPAGKGRQINREREVADMSRSLKALAMELHVPVVALSQLTDGKLRESRAIGHDADVVLIIGEAFDNDDKRQEKPLEDQRTIMIDKNRHGARDKQIRVGWSGPLMKFS